MEQALNTRNMKDKDIQRLIEGNEEIEECWFHSHDLQIWETLDQPCASGHSMEDLSFFCVPVYSCVRMVL